MTTSSSPPPADALAAMLQALTEHPFNPLIKIQPDSNWAVDARLPTVFGARFPGDPLAERSALAHGALGHVICIDHNLLLKPGATQLAIFKRLTCRPDQPRSIPIVGQTVAGIAELLRRGVRHPSQVSSLTLFLMAPSRDHSKSLSDRRRIREALQERVRGYDGRRDEWLRAWLLPTVERLRIRIEP